MNPDQHIESPLFLGDNLALDFINSAYGVGEGRRDYFNDDAAVVAWLKQAGALDQDVAVKATLGLKVVARRFRDSARKLVERRLEGGWADASELNRLLALGQIHQQLAWKRGGQPELQLVRTTQEPDAVLVPIAEALAALLVQPDMSRIRQCAGSDCTLLFHDHSRGGRRRWCDMAQCGNRAKVSSHRSREKHHTS
ncbi:CGNR zinc finger domain-containing protein [Luteibacter aegosomatissinici]|uniref:CGNR zinc finger domain-containing protein n=1 Tax=Luteibacter aegosomatissinici TaxID=2911539 RepID=UPI001FF81A7B|nr:CGNR zinc finger domain-containing protein [Luteibacter aegosomatissinici]UPG94542.1 CGNR zinc finger domain-containing protein [Luteibacter aegosomatissinici]